MNFLALMPLRAAIVHYHLRPGGVTRVIENATRALAHAGIRQCVILSSGPAPADPALNTRVIKALDYRTHPGSLTPSMLIDTLEREAHEALGAPPDLWHVHNHSLGKHCLFPGTLAALARKPARLLLQIHDFAEDGRPSNYANCPQDAVLYPMDPGVHYAAINQRDLRILQTAGIPQARLHWLPNPVPSPPSLPRPRARGKHPLLFYPVRGIRRKNLGEMLLLSLLAPKTARFVSAAPPDHPAGLAIHERWRQLAKQLQAPAWFGAANRLPPSEIVPHGANRTGFDAWMTEADLFFSTSIAEGFGLTFLEAFTANRALIGRDLPEITADFIAAGGKLPDLYQRLSVPLHWIGRDRLRKELHPALERHFALYGKSLPRDAVDLALAQGEHAPDRIDFGCLNEALQERILMKLHHTPALKDAVLAECAGETLPAREWLTRVLDPPSGSPEIALNRQVIERDYSLASYGKRLRTLYETILRPDPLPQGDSPTCAQKILDQFLSIERFHFLRS